MKEIWKNVLGYEGYYIVSNLGRVKRIALNTKYNSWRKERILHYNINNGGYCLVCLCVNNKPVKKLVHRIVYEAFNGPIPEGMQVNHINEIKTDNRLENLNLLSCKENNNWGTKRERLSASGKGKQTKIVFQYDKNGDLVQKWHSVTDASKTLNINSGDISKCCNGKQKTAGGFYWRYAS